MSLKNAVECGNIVRQGWPDVEFPLYIGSGRGGARFDAFGLMNHADCALRHADSWRRDEHAVDGWHPLGRIKWHRLPEAPQSYRQTLSLFDGRLQTVLEWPHLRVELTAYYHPARRDLLAIEIEYEGGMPLLQLETFGLGKAQFEDETAVFEVDDCVVALRVISEIGTAKIKADDGATVQFQGSRGRHLLLIGQGRSGRSAHITADLKGVQSIIEYSMQAASAWETRWGDACIEIPDAHLAALWARSMFYVLSTYGPDVASPAPPMGWSGAGWNVHFPQDLSYIHPALLRYGHHDIARAWVEWYRSYLDTMRDYTRRVWNAEGTMWAWTFPIGPDAPMIPSGGDWRDLPPVSDDWYQYEIHNAAYPARMARETAQFLNESHWSREVAWPIVLGSAQFFGSLLRQSEDGLWNLDVQPSTGQDEFGGHNAPNYLDALFSARYCLQTALAMARELEIELPEIALWAQILADGLAFSRLRDDATGLLRTCEQSGWQLGQQKHPVQLNALMFLPLEGAPNEYSKAAFRARHRLCIGASERRFYGWTLPAYWLAGVHLGQAQAFESDLKHAAPSRNVDADWIQLYESAPDGGPYFVTSHGLYLQAVADAFVCDFWGETQIGMAVPATWKGARFQNLRAKNGLLYSGDFDGENVRVTTKEGRGMVK